MDELTLVVLAAGIGSRFGGLKQTEPVSENNEFIIDYSIYDAIKAGFKRVVFVIKRENEEIFKETIGNRIAKYVEVFYAFQDIPNSITKERKKPLGTGHALICCKDYVTDKFAVINADDFYGKESYLKLSSFLKKIKKDSKEFCSISYPIVNTLTENGSIKRGILEANDGYLTDLHESKVEIKDGKVCCYDIVSLKEFSINSRDDEILTSMNMFGFTKEVFKPLEESFKKFLNDNKTSIDEEFLLPYELMKFTKMRLFKIKVIKTESMWYGITYKDDKPFVVNGIKKLVEENKYPKKLWE